MYTNIHHTPSRGNALNGILDTLSTAYLTREQKKIAEAEAKGDLAQTMTALKLAQAKQAEVQGQIDLENLRLAQAANKQQFIGDLVKRGLPVIVVGALALKYFGGKKKRR